MLSGDADQRLEIGRVVVDLDSTDPDLAAALAVLLPCDLLDSLGGASNPQLPVRHPEHGTVGQQTLEPRAGSGRKPCRLGEDILSTEESKRRTMR